MFIDAQEMEKLHPDTFEAPSKKELKNLKVDDSVKICNGRERFWVTITKIGKQNNQKLRGTVNNNLVDPVEYDFGDEVKFEKRHIYIVGPR